MTMAPGENVRNLVKDNRVGLDLSIVTLVTPPQLNLEPSSESRGGTYPTEVAAVGLVVTVGEVEERPEGEVSNAAVH